MARSAVYLTIREDRISAKLATASGLKSVNGLALMRGIGTALVAMAQRTFNDPGLRSAPWAPKRDGSPSNLKKKGRLRSSIRVVAATAGSVRIGSDAKYAAIHQWGGVTPPRIIRPRAGKALKFSIGGTTIFRKAVRHPGSKVPARPFLPITAQGGLTAKAERNVEALVDKAVRTALG